MNIQVSPHTIKHWIATLEHMYVLFPVTPYHHNIVRSLLKEPKIYFYDTGAVRGDAGAKLENATAVCLKKWLHFLEDAHGKDVRLHYVRDKEKREVYFLAIIEGKIDSLIEVKLSQEELHSPLRHFHERLRPRRSAQLVHGQIRPKTIQGVSITPAGPWLANLEA